MAIVTVKSISNYNIVIIYYIIVISVVTVFIWNWLESGRKSCSPRSKSEQIRVMRKKTRKQRCESKRVKIMKQWSRNRNKITPGGSDEDAVDKFPDIHDSNRSNSCYVAEREQTGKRRRK